MIHIHYINTHTTSVRMIPLFQRDWVRNERKYVWIY